MCCFYPSMSWLCSWCQVSIRQSNIIRHCSKDPFLYIDGFPINMRSALALGPWGFNILGISWDTILAYLRDLHGDVGWVMGFIRNYLRHASTLMDLSQKSLWGSYQFDPCDFFPRRKRDTDVAGTGNSRTPGGLQCWRCWDWTDALQKGCLICGWLEL